MDAPARVPCIAFIAPEMAVSKGLYPVYLYYKELETLILAYGISETEEFGRSWPPEIMTSTTKIAAHFDKDVPLLGASHRLYLNLTKPRMENPWIDLKEEVKYVAVKVLPCQSQRS